MSKRDTLQKIVTAGCVIGASYFAGSFIVAAIKRHRVNSKPDTAKAKTIISGHKF